MRKGKNEIDVKPPSAEKTLTHSRKEIQSVLSVWDERKLKGTDPPLPLKSVTHL